MLCAPILICYHLMRARLQRQRLYKDVRYLPAPSLLFATIFDAPCACAFHAAFALVMLMPTTRLMSLPADDDYARCHLMPAMPKDSRHFLISSLLIATDERAPAPPCKMPASRCLMLMHTSLLLALLFTYACEPLPQDGLPPPKMPAQPDAASHSPRTDTNSNTLYGPFQVISAFLLAAMSLC